jgi:hypothetical protein
LKAIERDYYQTVTTHRKRERYTASSGSSVGRLKGTASLSVTTAADVPKKYKGK